MFGGIFMLEFKYAVFISGGIVGGVIIALVVPSFWAVVICGGAVFIIIRYLCDRPCHRRR